VSEFSPDEIRRYARQLVLKGLGGPGQQKLKASRVLVVGAGGLGSPVIAYLAAAGVGTIGIVDHDTVAVSNLQRQVIHGTGDVGAPKVETARAFVTRLNPNVTVETHQASFDPVTGPEIVSRYDLVLDCTDDFTAREAVAEAAAAAQKPLVFGAVAMFEGQVTVFLPGAGNPGFRDLFPAPLSAEDAPSCELVGVLGSVVGVIGTLMATEAIKLITGLGDPLVGRLLLYDGRAVRFTEIAY
jgi:molybdopterin/thiamine biosynthesis adenylyltransferase